MKVFLSWSQDLSHSVAKYFEEWLPGVIQECSDPFISSDMDKGDPWFQTITANLDSTEVGIVFITAENQDAVWLNFEAGAMLNKFGKSGVCPVLVGLKKNDYKGPLKNLQLTEITDEADVRKLLRTINKKGDSPLSSTVLDKMFGKFWTELHETVVELIDDHANAGHATQRKRSVDDKVDELLTLVRGLTSRGSSASLEESLVAELRRRPVAYAPEETSWNLRGSLTADLGNLIHKQQQESTRQERMSKFIDEHGSIYATMNSNGDIVHIIDAFDMGDAETEVLVSSGIHRKMQTVPISDITLIRS